MIDDDWRNGTTTLFTGPNIPTGEVFGRNMQRHRHRALVRFLDALERERHFARWCT